MVSAVKTAVAPHYSNYYTLHHSYMFQLYLAILREIQSKRKIYAVVYTRHSQVDSIHR